MGGVVREATKSPYHGLSGDAGGSSKALLELGIALSDTSWRWASPAKPPLTTSSSEKREPSEPDLLRMSRAKLVQASNPRCCQSQR
jgi:hypothetical protein